jgi:hypothetical protein
MVRIYKELLPFGKMSSVKDYGLPSITLDQGELDW